MLDVPLELFEEGRIEPLLPGSTRTEMPVFMLDVAACPGGVVPLHIFEMRYRQVGRVARDSAVVLLVKLVELLIRCRFVGNLLYTAVGDDFFRLCRDREGWDELSTGAFFLLRGLDGRSSCISLRYAVAGREGPHVKHVCCAVYPWTACRFLLALQSSFPFSRTGFDMLYGDENKPETAYREAIKSSCLLSVGRLSRAAFTESIKYRTQSPAVCMI